MLPAWTASLRVKLSSSSLSWFKMMILGSKFLVCLVLLKILCSNSRYLASSTCPFMMANWRMFKLD